VTVAGFLSAARWSGTRLSDHRIAILGAGASAIGISDQIVAALVSEGSAESEARQNLWLTDSKGLVHTQRDDLDLFKRRYARDSAQTTEWKPKDPARIGLLDVVTNVHPTILLGVSAQPGSFTEEIVREMTRHTERPVIFPLSNPTSKSEATAIDLFRWTDGRAIIATGSPSPPIGSIRIGQCNNSFIFPGVGLGVISSGAQRVTDAMFVAAAKVLSELSPSRHDPDASLYPPLEKVKDISRLVAMSVGSEAYRAGLSSLSNLDDLEDRVLANMWQPHYVSLQSRWTEKTFARSE
jgi:malate dehydrogenase (oxaloacetate-decarboxylating)